MIDTNQPGGLPAFRAGITEGVSPGQKRQRTAEEILDDLEAVLAAADTFDDASLEDADIAAAIVAELEALDGEIEAMKAGA